MNRYLDIIGGLEDQVCRFQPVIIDFPRSSPSLRPRDENSDNVEDDEPHGQIGQSFMDLFDPLRAPE
jgi:hypothetical protein